MAGNHPLAVEIRPVAPGSAYQVTRLRLDTSDFLTEACQLYIRNGYQETAPFSDARLANLWLGKDLG
jgi:hypothetical protein